MKKIYCKAIVSITALAALFGSALFLNNTYAGYFTMWGNRYECTDPTADWYNATHNICYSWCFVEETKVTMADGSEKNIEDVVAWDWLKWSIWPNKVQYVIRKSNDWKIYSFNGWRYFVTDSHPFQTTKWWKSINPEATKKWYPDFEVWKLEIGDILITENGNVELKSLDGKDDPQDVYTFSVDGTHDYYADGYLVHNKYAGNNGSCPAGWYEPGGPTYDWWYSIQTYNEGACVLRDLWQPVNRWPAGWGTVLVDTDIVSMIYWDKNSNNVYDSWSDRPFIVPTYATSTSWNSWIPYFLTTPYYISAAQLWYNNAINLSYQWLYTYGISQGNSIWGNLMNQWFTTNDAIVNTTNVTNSFGYITWLNVGLEYSCAGTGTQTVAFIEYNCPAWYVPSGASCYTWSNTVWWPCVSNADCTSGWTCNGYSYTPPNSEFKYDDGQPWNSSHPNWNQRPHGNWAGYCRNGDEAYWCVPNDPNQNPNWYWWWVLCGCGNFVPNNDGVTTYGSCTTSSSNYIAPTEVTVTETVQCTGTWGWSCTPNRTCWMGYTLTGDTNGNGTPNCINGWVTAALDTISFGPSWTCNGTAMSTCAQILPCSCDSGNGFECDTNNNTVGHWWSAPQQCQDLQGDINGNHTINYYRVTAGWQTESTDSNNCSGWTGGSCVSNRTCSMGYTLTGDTNWDWNPNCVQTTCNTTTWSTSWFYYPFDRTQPWPINVSCWAAEDWYSNSCGTSFWNVTCELNGGIVATTDINVEYRFRAPGDPNCVLNTTIPNGSSSVSTSLSCWCSIAATPEAETIHVVSPTSMDWRWFWEYFIFQSSTGVDINADITNCWCDAWYGSTCPYGVWTWPVQLDGTYWWCSDYIGWTNYEWNIYGYKQPQTIWWWQTICSNDFEEATDTNNCAWCVTTTEPPAVCDINDPLMAWVCYIPGGFGTTLLVSDGKVGINTINPEYALDVDGVVRAAEVLTLSDARLKTSIEKIDTALEKISAINWYAFTWKDSWKPDLWVLAQEIEKVFTDAVSTDKDGTKTVQYNTLLAPIIEAIHELNTQIDTLYNEKFNNQVDRIEAIEKAVK